MGNLMIADWSPDVRQKYREIDPLLPTVWLKYITKMMIIGKLLLELGKVHT